MASYFTWEKLSLGLTSKGRPRKTTQALANNYSSSSYKWIRISTKIWRSIEHFFWVINIYLHGIELNNEFGWKIKVRALDPMCFISCQLWFLDIAAKSHLFEELDFSERGSKSELTYVARSEVYLYDTETILNSKKVIITFLCVVILENVLLILLFSLNTKEVLYIWTSQDSFGYLK